VTDRFLRACRRQPVDVTPVWFMRQAGRYMPEYRALRERYSLLDICRRPELAVKVTLQPLDAIEVDAAILFSDLLLPFTPLGLEFDFLKGEGPAVANPVRTESDVDRLKRFEPREALGHVLETIRLLRATLANRAPLIGFAGAPFTLAAYAIEGGPSTNYAKTKAFMYSSPRAWHRLCARFAEMAADFLKAQVEAGAQALQIFDSWAGTLSRGDYRELALPHTKFVFQSLADTGVPLVHFGVGTTAILRDLAEAGGDVIGVDWRLPLDEAWSHIGFDRAIQGNLDPALLLGPSDRMLAQADEVLRRAGGRPGHVFNLGHGVLPETPLEHVQELARHVHRVSRVQKLESRS
jgi:uroporphyrinogen decarboxylase